MSNSSIMSVREMIDTAFGDPRRNTVDHKLIQAILFLLARQLRMLERRVEVEIGPLPYIGSESSLSVTELKIHAMQKKKPAGKSKDARPSVDTKQDIYTGKRGARFTSPEEVSLESAAITTTEGKSVLDKTATWSSADKISSDKTTSELTSTDKTTTLTSTDKTTTSTSDKTTTELSTTDKSTTLTSDKTTTDLSSTDKTTTLTSTDLTSTDKTTTTTTDITTTEFSITYKSTSPSDKTTTELSSTDKATTTTDKTTSSSDKPSTGLSTTDRTATSTTDKTTSGIPSSDVQPTSTSGISSSDVQPTSTTGISSSDKRTTTSEKTYTEKPSTDKSSSDKTSTEKTTTDKTSTEKTSSDKTTTEESTDKYYGNKVSYSRLSMDKGTTIKSSTQKPSFGKLTTVMASTDKFGKPMTDKGLSGKLDKKWSERTYSPSSTSTETTSTDGSSTDRSTGPLTKEKKIGQDKSASTGKGSTSLKRPMADTGSGAKRKPEDYQKLLETIEERRERELRIIHQRVNSFEEPIKTPTPMASLDSVEAKFEKLLVVERVPADEARARAAGRGQGRTPQLSVVTQEQFRALEEEVRKLQEQFFPSGLASFPENAQLMAELRKGASLTDAMAALQLSARMEAAEKTLTQMLSIVTDLARQSPGIDLSAPPGETRIIFGPKSFEPSGLGTGGGKGARGGMETAGGGKVKAGVGASEGGGPGDVQGTGTKGQGTLAKGAKGTKRTPTDHTPPPSMLSLSVEMALPQTFQGDELLVEGPDGVKIKPDRITYEELEHAMDELHDEIMKKVTGITGRSNNNADNALKIALRLDGKLDASLNFGDRMADLETLIANYAEKINVLDTGLSSQMTNYQELLTQMQHDLEVGLETMAEVLANSGGDTTAVAELNAHFSNFQLEIDNMMQSQKDLKINQVSLSSDLEGLWKQIELLRESKSDREEVADALRDKAGIGALNGLMSLQQFEAVRGDFEKRIAAAYDKFNNQEIIWQKAIDELVRELNEKAELIQVLSLKDEIDKHLNQLKSRVNAMLEIVGEPRAAAISRNLHRDAACLSCSTPAYMGLEEPGKVAALPAFQAKQPGSQAAGGATSPGATGTRPKTKGDGDHGLCYPGLPIPHPRDPRAHVCQRYCGGSHTLITNTIPRVPPGFTINSIQRPITTGPGTDGKMYLIDEPIRKPCLPCNTPKATTPRVALEPLDLPAPPDNDGTSMTPPDFLPISQFTIQATDIELSVSTTPPPPIED